MEAVIGLLLMLLSVSHGIETYCDGRQDGAQCYGALGGTVVIQLMDSTSEIFRYIWSNKTRQILHGKKNKIVFNLIKDRSSFTPSDGTFRINSLSRTDGGEYTLTTFDSNGRRSAQRTLQLTFQGFVFVDCTLINGTHMSQWVLEANFTLCITPTTPTTVGLFLLILRAAVILMLTGIFIYFAWKKKQEISEGSVVRRKREHQENSVVMVEVRSSASEL